MTDYRRIYMPGATWFFTVNLAERKGNRLLIDHIDALRQAFIQVRHKHPFQIEAAVVLPDHCIVFGRYRRVMIVFLCGGDWLKAIFPDLSKTGRGYPQAVANGVSEGSGRGGFGITLSGMMRIIAPTLITSIGIR